MSVGTLLGKVTTVVTKVDVAVVWSVASSVMACAVAVEVASLGSVLLTVMFSMGVK